MPSFRYIVCGNKWANFYKLTSKQISAPPTQILQSRSSGWHQWSHLKCPTRKWVQIICTILSRLAQPDFLKSVPFMLSEQAVLEIDCWELLRAGQLFLCANNPVHSRRREDRGSSEVEVFRVSLFFIFVPQSIKLFLNFYWNLTGVKAIHLEGQSDFPLAL